jgi:hypothetical protein
MAKDHGSSVKNDKQYEGLGSGGNQAQKMAAGRKGGKKS